MDTNTSTIVGVFFCIKDLSSIGKSGIIVSIMREEG